MTDTNELQPEQLRILYILQLADNALILGHRLSEWCGHGPILEQDIAITNISLDHLGQARSLYQHAAELCNALPAPQRAALFSSPMIAQVSGDLDEDDLAYLRDAWDFRNLLLAEQPNADWAHTVVRSFFIDCFQLHQMRALMQSTDETLRAVAENSLKEVTYHVRWSSEWIIRMGDGTDESRRRLQEALHNRWMYSGEALIPSAADQYAAATGLGPDPAALRADWEAQIAEVLDEATLAVPSGRWMQQGGKEGRHSEHLGYILAEMQFLQRAYPNMEW